LRGFKANNCNTPDKLVITDENLRHLKNFPNFEVLEINHCSNLTAKCLDYLIKDNKSFRQLKLSGVKNFIEPRLTNVIKNSVKTLRNFDASFMPQTKFSNELFAQLGMCEKLESVNISNNSSLTHMQIERFLKGVYDEDMNEYKRAEEDMPGHFPNLKYLNFN